MIVDPATTKNLMVNYPHVIQAKLLANDEYIRTHKDVDSRYSKLAAKANSSV